MRSTFAEIDLRAINTNLKTIRKTIGKHPLIMAVVKANAYGHGMVPVVRSIIKNQTAQYFGVAIAEEGIELRKEKVTQPILVLTTPNRDQLDLFLKYNLEATVCDLQTAQRLNQLAKAKNTTAEIHIKIDTGMGRIGVEAKDSIQFVEKVLRMSNLSIKGICTHFATSDEKDLTYANEQLKLFRSIVTELELRGIHIPLVHCANSGAIMQMPDSYFDMVRPGIMIYGYTPSNEFETKLLLKPVLSLKAKIGFVKRVEQGQSISYNRRFITK